MKNEMKAMIVLGTLIVLVSSSIVGCRKTKDEEGKSEQNQRETSVNSRKEIAEESKQTSNAGSILTKEVAIPEKDSRTSKITFSNGVFQIGDFSVALSSVERKEKEADLHFAITKVKNTGSEIKPLAVTLTDDHENNYTSRLEITPYNDFPLNLLPVGFTYVKAASVGIPKPAPIETIQVGDTEEMVFKRLKLVEPQLKSDFGTALLQLREPTPVGEFLLFSIDGIVPDLYTWALAATIENKDYNQLRVGITCAVQFTDGKIAPPETPVTVSVSGLSKEISQIRLDSLRGKEDPQTMMLLVLFHNQATRETVLKLCSISAKDFPPRVGQGTNEGIFIEAYRRNGGREAMGDPLGLPRWFAGDSQPKSGRDLLIQEFPGVSQFGKSAILWDKQNNADKAYVIHGAVWETYLSLGGPASWLGFPTSGLHTSVAKRRALANLELARAPWTDKRYPMCKFEGGYIGARQEGGNYEIIRYQRYQVGSNNEFKIRHDPQYGTLSYVEGRISFVDAEVLDDFTLRINVKYVIRGQGGHGQMYASPFIPRDFIYLQDELGNIYPGIDAGGVSNTGITGKVELNKEYNGWLRFELPTKGSTVLFLRTVPIKWSYKEPAGMLFDFQFSLKAIQPPPASAPAPSTSHGEEESPTPVFKRSVKQQLIRALQDLRLAIMKKIHMETDVTAQCFTSVKEYRRAKLLADVLRPVLKVLQGTLSVLSKIGDTATLSGQVKTSLDNAQYVSEAASLFFMVNGLRESGEKLYYAIDDTAGYVRTVKDMLQAADQTTVVRMDPRAYKQVIKQYLDSEQGTPLVIARTSELAPDKKPAKGALVLYKIIREEFRTLVDQIQRSELPPEFPVNDVVAEIEQLKQHIIEAGVHNIDVHYSVYHQGRKVHQSRKLGAVAEHNKAFAQVAGALAKRLDIEIYAECAQLAATGADAAYIVTYKVPGAGEAVKMTQQVSLLPQIVIEGKKMFTVDPEEQFYQMPQEMLFSLAIEFSSLLRIADDTVLSLTGLLEETGSQVPPSEVQPTPTSTKQKEPAKKIEKQVEEAVKSLFKELIRKKR